jgi:hypothetical protein
MTNAEWDALPYRERLAYCEHWGPFEDLNNEPCREDCRNDNP